MFIEFIGKRFSFLAFTLFLLVNEWNIVPGNCDSTSTNCDTSNVTITQVTNKIILFGDGAFYDNRTNSVLFVNSVASEVYRYDINTKGLFYVQIGIPVVDIVQFVVPVQGTNDQFLISIDNELAVIIWDGVNNSLKAKRTVNSLYNNPQLVDDVNFGNNQVGAITAPASLPNLSDLSALLDSSATVPSRLYLLTPDNEAKLVANASNLIFINGVVFSLNQTVLYLTDTITNAIFAYEYDSVSNTIDNGRIFYRNQQGIGFLDGMTLDGSGNLLVADLLGGQLLSISTQTGEGQLRCTIKLPALIVTKAALAADGTIYFTAYAPGSTGAGLYSITGVQGIPYQQLNNAPQSFTIQ